MEMLGAGQPGVHMLGGGGGGSLECTCWGGGSLGWC